MKQMKRMIVVLLILLAAWAGVHWLQPKISAQQEARTEERAAKKGAKTYTNTQFKQGRIPYRSGIKLHGQIIQTDAKNKQRIGKNDRIVLRQNGTKYQVLVACQKTLKMNQTVTVYGTFMGLIRADWIE